VGFEKENKSGSGKGGFGDKGRGRAGGMLGLG